MFESAQIYLELFTEQCPICLIHSLTSKFFFLFKEQISLAPKFYKLQKDCHLPVNSFQDTFWPSLKVASFFKIII